MPEDPFSAGAVAVVTRHMNDDHAADNVVICRALGGHRGATEATMVGMDPDGIEFVAAVNGRPVTVRIAWTRRPVTRADVRTEVVQMYRDASATLGLD